MSNDPKSETLLGLPDIGGLAKLLQDAKEFFAEVQVFIEELKALYAEHKGDIDALLAFAKEAMAFLRGLIETIRGLFGTPATGGGLVG